MAGMTGKTIAATYHGILKTAGDNVNIPTGSTGVRIVDGEETVTALYLTDGEVSIGTATPQFKHTGSASYDVVKLSVVSDVADDGIYIGAEHGNKVASLMFGATNASSEQVRGAQITSDLTTTTDASEKGYLALWTNNASGVAERVRIAEDGDVGIGTTAPISLLDVQGGTGTGFTGAGKLSLTTAELTIVDNDVLGIIQFEASLESSATDAVLPAAAIWAEAEDTFAADNNSCALVFSTASSENALATAQERMRIDNTGKVGIGIAPATPLHVRSDSGAEGVVRFENNEGTVETADAILVCDYSDDTDVDGAAMISFEDETAEVGSISVDADTTSYNTSSDYRLKTDLKDIADAIGTIKKLKLYDFAWKKNEQKRGMGVLAHEAQPIVPQAIKGIKDAMGIKRYTEDGVKKTRETIRPQQADYSQFVPLLLKAMQELSAKVDALENNNNEQGDSSNEQEQEGSDSGVSSSESTGQDSGGDEGNNSDSSGAASGASEASDSSSDDGNESAGSSGSDASDDSEGGSGADDSTGSEGESSGDSGSDSVDDG